MQRKLQFMIQAWIIAKESMRNTAMMSNVKNEPFHGTRVSHQYPQNDEFDPTASFPTPQGAKICL